MDIDYLKEFIILAQTENFLEAADLLYSSQSTLSKHLKNLETELGVQLFDRTTRKVIISKYGQTLLPFAEQIVSLHDQFTMEIKRIYDVNQDVLNLGTIPAMAEYDITDVIVNFKKIQPKSIVNVIQGGSTEMKEMLRQRKCDVAFIRFTEDSDNDIVKIPFTTDSLVAVLPTSHPLAKQKVISLKLLANENLVLSEKHTMLYQLSYDACKNCGFEPKVIYSDHKYENILDFVTKGMGIALMMKKLAVHSPLQPVAIVEITPTVITNINLCYLMNATLSDAARHFIECAK